MLILDTYRTALAARPLVTNMVTASVLSVFSDSVAQHLESNSSPAQHRTHDWQRALAMATFGAFVYGAFVQYWFRFLNSFAALRVVPGDWPAVCRRVAVNQACMSPFLNSLFFAWVVFTRSSDPNRSLTDKMATLRRKLAQVCSRLAVANQFNHSIPPSTSLTTTIPTLPSPPHLPEQDLVPTIKRSMAYWTTFNLGNFGLTPFENQVVVTNLGFVAWTVYLSIVGYRRIGAAPVQVPVHNSYSKVF